MIKLSKMSDHALALAGALASSPHESRPAAEWGRLARVSAPTAVKLLKKFSAAELCESKRGKDGGYRLRSDPSAVTFLQVVEAVDGPIRFSECAPGAIGCKAEAMCAVRPHAVKIGAGIRALLANLAISELAKTGVSNGQ